MTIYKNQGTPWKVGRCQATFAVLSSLLCRKPSVLTCRRCRRGGCPAGGSPAAPWPWPAPAAGTGPAPWCCLHSATLRGALGSPCTVATTISEPPLLTVLGKAGAPRSHSRRTPVCSAPPAAACTAAVLQHNVNIMKILGNFGVIYLGSWFQVSGLGLG